MKLTSCLGILAVGSLGIIVLASRFFDIRFSGKWYGDGTSFGLSPDGKTIVFTGAGKSTSDLYLLDLETLHVLALTQSPQEGEGLPQFSPDGKQIVYTSNGKRSRHIFIISVDGVQRQQLTYDEAVNDTTPVFTPDGTQILFARAARYRPYAFGGMVWDDYDIYIMNKDGSGLRQLTDKKYYQAFGPRMSPQNWAVIYQAEHGTEHQSATDILHVDADHPGEPVVVSSSGHASDPVFSASGDHIYFNSHNGDYDYNIWVMDRDGKNVHQVTQSLSYINNIEASPDGERLYVLSDRKRRSKFDLEEVRISDGQTRRIADSHFFTDPLRRKLEVFQTL